jgi:hypothetical protein
MQCRGHMYLPDAADVSFCKGQEKTGKRLFFGAA